MKVFNTENMVPFDVDDTLVMWHLDDKSKDIQIEHPYQPGIMNHVTPHEKHIKLLKDYKGRGFTVVVWSAGGVEWAHAVVKALGIEEYVDAVFTKPCRYVDDLQCEKWMGNRVYIK
jgi:FMN phosphatase YigB (HAD superfamily)